MANQADSVPVVRFRAWQWFGVLAVTACTNAMALPFGQSPSESVRKHSDLCQSEEEVVFTCHLQARRVVSVCASKHLDSQHGHMQYRFGKPGRTEIALPAMTADAAWRHSVVAKKLQYSAGGGNYLRFNQPPFSYTVYSAFGARWGEKAGVMEWKNEEMVGHHPCVGAPQSQMGPDLQERAGLGEDPDELVLP